MVQRWYCDRLQVHVVIYFFFQAEDGIRDYKVTGVQTCALPISRRTAAPGCPIWLEYIRCLRGRARVPVPAAAVHWSRSEERRVGKSVDLGGRRIIKKKKKR